MTIEQNKQHRSRNAFASGIAELHELVIGGRGDTLPANGTRDGEIFTVITEPTSGTYEINIHRWVSYDTATPTTGEWVEIGAN